MNPKPIEDKRAFKRIPSNAPVDVCRLSFPVAIKSEGIGKGKDISDGGICFIYSEPFEPGQMLALQVDLRGWESHKRPYSMFVDIASEKPFTAIAEVIWCRPSDTDSGFDIGIKFTGVDEDDLKAFSRYLSRNNEADID